METQKASKSELFVQLVYASAAAVGFAYVSVLIFALATGNREPLTEHPSITAFLCLLSGISLANLCRHKSARFWKIADLVWIVTFVPSLAMTVLLHQNEQDLVQLNERIEADIEQHRWKLRNWNRMREELCLEQENFDKQVCPVLLSHGWWATKYLSSKEKYLEFLEGKNLEPMPPGFLQFLIRATKSKYFHSSLQERIDANLSPLAKHIVELTAQLDEMYISELNLSSDLSENDFDAIDKALQLISKKRFERFLATPLGGDSVGQSGIDYESPLMSEIFSQWHLYHSFLESIKNVHDINTFYEREILSRIANIKFLPLMIACFVFPFRVGKSIYEIAAKKESKNATLSS